MVEASPEPVAAAGGGASGTAAPRKGKSCKGCLYYSSVLKSRGYNPICVGIPRSIPQVPNYVVDEPKEEATAQGHDLRRFRYGCAGYSMFVDNRDGQGGESEGKTLLPYCRGLEGPLVPKPNYRRSPAPPSARRRIAAWAPPFVRDRRRPQYVYAKAVHLVGFRRREDRSDQLLVDSRLVERKPSTAEQAPAHVAKDAATTRSHQQGQQRPANLSRQEFLERFKRSAGLVASGVAKNLNKTAHYIKENIQDILYPDRRPPK